MSSLRNIILLGVLSTLATRLVVAEPSGNSGSGDEVVGDNVPFQELLNSVPQDNLHAALHESLPLKYKHGVFEGDQRALEALHRDNAEIATKVIVLAKRQTNSTARPTSSNPVTSNPANNPSTTTAAGQSSSPSQAPSSGIPTGGLTVGGVITTTDASGNTGASTLSAGSVVTATDGTGNVVTVTVDPSAATSSTAAPESSSSVTSTVLQTTTLPNGARSTVTAVTVVGASAGSETPSGTAGAAPASTTTGSSGLQAGSAMSMSKVGGQVLALAGGALVFAMAMQY